ncbi:metallophosphoesterase [Ureibacillus sp. NPDC094379]
MNRNKSLQRLLSLFLVLALVFTSFSPYASTAEAAEVPTEKVLLERASTWKYLDDGTDQGTSWKDSNFDDSTWKSGQAPLGYPTGEDHGTFPEIATVVGFGGDSQNKYATTYFRTTFNVENLSDIGNQGLITAGIDDSAIVYLNGHEIGRYNLPADQVIPFNKYVQDYGLNDASESSDKTFKLTAEQLSYLVKGTNVLAVEVHQDRPSSSDLFLDMEFKSIYVDESIYQATNISFAPGADETKYNFSWYSPETTQPGVIQYAKKSEGSVFPETAAKEVTATLAKASTGFSANEATIMGIESSTEYVYRLGDGNGKWSETFSFKTQETDSYNFLFMGDPQIGSSGNIESDTKGWVNTLNKAVEKFPNTSFIQSAGDQVNNANSEEEYAGFFAPEILKQIPTATTIGNHDVTEAYEYHFNVPNQNPSLGNKDNSGGDYYFTYGDTLIMNLNSNNKNAAEHSQFMEETIAENPDATWKIVVFHHSIYSAASHSLESGIIKLREDLVPTIDKLDIDAVLMGHDHSYVRTYQMKNLQPLKSQMVNDEGSVINPEGTVYMTANSSSGSKYYGLKPDREPYAVERTQLRTPTFTNVEVSPTSLEFTTYRVDTMEVVDSYKIIKDDSIEVELPALKEVNIKATGTVLPTEASTFYPEVKFSVTGTNVNDGPFDIAYTDITYKTDKEGQISISQDGQVTVLEGATPGQVTVWAEVMNEGKTFETDKLAITIVEHNEQTLLKKGSHWKYLDNGSNQETAWKEPEFDDSNWKSGAAPLGYPVSEKRPMFGNVVTEISYGPDSQKKYPTTYFRTEFEVKDLSKLGELARITFGIDDSVILYLNGHEIGRHNLPEGNITFDKYLSDLSGSNVADESAYETFELTKEDLTHLVEGKNVLAAEVHQDRPTSSDVYWDMEFVTATTGASTEEPTPTPEEKVLLPYDAEWSYLDDGTDLGKDWITNDYDYSSWKKGNAPLGFGDAVSETNPEIPLNTEVSFGDDEDNKHMTTYFKKAIDVPSLEGYEGLEVYIHVDDAAVVYINGEEAFRKGIDEGVEVTYETPGKFKAKEETFYIPASALKEGTNIISAEAHQDGGDSSDLWFEMSIKAVTEIPEIIDWTTTPIPNKDVEVGEVSRVVVSFYGDTETSKGFTWYTSQASGKSDLQVIEKTTEEPNFENAKEFTGDYQRSTSAPQYVVHKAVATDLKPGTEYQYRVGDASLGLWSDVGSFVTADGDDEFTFINLTDTQAKTEDEAILSSATFAKARETVKDAEFILGNGDIVDTGSKEEQWGWVLDHSKETLMNTTFASSAGNHDEDKNSFIEHFNVKTPEGSSTKTGAYYSYDYGNTHFVILNTNEDSEEYQNFSPEQIEWLQADIKAAKADDNIDWIIANIHKGPYTTSNHATDDDIMGENGVREKLPPMLYELGVDLVLQGHDHIYARTKPIQNGNAVEAEKVTEKFNGIDVEYSVNPDGAIYVIPSTAGPKVYYKNKKIDLAYYNLFEVADEHSAAKYGPDPNDDSRPVRSVVQNFVEFHVDGNKLTGITYEIDQTINNGEPFVVDAFGIIKGEKTPIDSPKDYNLKNFKTKKLFITKPNSVVNIIDETTIISEEIFVKASATLKGDGLKDKTVTISPTGHDAVINLSGADIKEVRLQTNKIIEIKGAENVKSWDIPKGVDLSGIKIFNSKGKEITDEVKSNLEKRS